MIYTFPGCDRPEHREGILSLMLSLDPPVGGVFECGCMFELVDAPPSAPGRGVGTRRGKRR